jgi:hypothetical protein
VDPTSTGYRVTPHLPLPRYSLRMPGYGIAVDRRKQLTRGYVTPQQSGSVRFDVTPRGGRPAHPVVRVNGARTTFTQTGAGTLSFTASLTKDRPTDWSIASR